MSKFIERAVIIEAIRFMGDNLKDILEFAGDRASPSGGDVRIHTDLGPVVISTGYWVIRRANGQYTTCENDLFQWTYGPLSQEEEVAIEAREEAVPTPETVPEPTVTVLPSVEAEPSTLPEPDVKGTGTAPEVPTEPSES